jgi:tRNA G18 (ribose-2'-O)-methylase SpoU
MREPVRHKPPVALERPRELVVACAPMRSHVNLSRIVRAAGCAGVERVICCGAARIDRRIARDGADAVRLEVHRTLAPVLAQLREEGYRLVALEQATEAANLHEYRFARRSALVVGNERLGLLADVLRLADDVVEIPVWGLPYAYNVASAVDMAIYEYCRQFPRG